MLGVVPYLERGVVMATLAQVASMTTRAGGIVFDFGLPPEQLTMLQRIAFEALAARVRAAGEPWRTFFDPGELSRELLALGLLSRKMYRPQPSTPAILPAAATVSRSEGWGT